MGTGRREEQVREPGAVRAHDHPSPFEERDDLLEGLPGAVHHNLVVRELLRQRLQDLTLIRHLPAARAVPRAVDNEVALFLGQNAHAQGLADRLQGLPRGRNPGRGGGHVEHVSRVGFVGLVGHQVLALETQAVEVLLLEGHTVGQDLCPLG